MKKLLYILAVPSALFAQVNTPIPTACLQHFLPNLFSPALSTSVNLAVCQVQNKKTPNMAAHFIGKTDGGILVFNIKRHFGGSGVFQTILLLKKGVLKQYSASGKTIKTSIISNAGILNGGDRYTGSFYNLSIHQNTLSAWQYSKQNPANVKKYPSHKVSFQLTPR